MESGAGPRHMRFLALGDSYTVGELVAPEEAWPRQLATRLRRRGWDLEPTIVATTGWTSGELLAALDEDSPEGTFDLVSLQVGVNDQYRGLPVDELVANAEVLLGRARRFRGQGRGGIFVVSIPDWGVTPFAAGGERAGIAGDIDRFNDAWSRLAAGADTPFVDVTLSSRRRPGSVAPDGLHPSGDQYRRWVDVIAPVVEEILAVRNG